MVGPSPTYQASKQDPASDKSQGGGGPDPRYPSGSALVFVEYYCLLNIVGFLLKNNLL